MGKINEITPFYTNNIPKELEEGILYIHQGFISGEISIAIHLCACGCKGKTVTPLKTVAGITGWTLTKNEGKVTLHPSIGNFGGENPYHAHYFIVDNKIVWC